MVTKRSLTVLGLAVVMLLVAGVPAGAGGFTLRWSGQDWWVLDRETPCCAGPNLWEADNVSVDAAGHLHMKIAYVDGAWRSAELVGERSLGHGTYRWTIASRLDVYDPNMVLGLFVYGDDPAYAHREIDMEFSGWGGSVTERGQFSVQPDGVDGNRYRYTPLPARGVYSFNWQPGKVSFKADWGKLGRVSWTYRRTVPDTLDETPRMNFWLFNGAAPLLGGEAEVVIERFQFVPAG